MRRILKTAAALALVTSAPGFVSAAFAHGGQYRGPAGEVPPDSREPSDPPPPPEGGGPQTPGGEQPGGPTTGGPDAGGPSTPGGGGGGPSSGSGGAPPPTGGGGGGGGPSTGGRPKSQGKGAGYEDWTFWWNYNKDEILQLKSAVKKMQQSPRTGSSAGAFGRKSSGEAIKSATDESIQKSIVPLLHQLLDDKEVSFHIQSAAELGLAKIGDESILDTLKKMATNDAKAYHREVQETAGLALGLLQKDTPETRAFLIDIIKGTGRDDTYVRPFSALSLGLLGDKNDKDRTSMTALLDQLAQKEAKGDIKPACLTAVGLLNNDAAVPELLAIVQTGSTTAKGAEKLNETEVAYAISALGKIGRPGLDKKDMENAVLDELCKILDGKSKTKRGTNELRSAAIALGQIAPNTDAKQQKKIMEVLKDLTKDASDTQTKNFAIISLGRMGASKNVDEKVVRTEIISILRDELKNGKGLTPPFAALALGLVGRAISDEGKPAPEEEIRAPIRAKFAEGGEAKSRGAYAVASGLVRDTLAVEDLKKTLKDRGADKKVRGYCALGLGMIGDPSAVDAIKSTMKDDNDRDLRVQTAMAAGLMGDGSVIFDIVAILKDKDASNYELGSAALSLGQIGDERAIEALVEITKDEKKNYPDLTRALATVALGQIGDRRDVPTLARVATDINYRAHVAAITELLDIL